jgi:hypothetical protein
MLGAALLLGAAAIGVGIACIIPDEQIQVLVADVNASPVRFVEGITLDEAARCACSASSCECPMPGVTGIPTYLDPATYPFCVCGDNEIDVGRLYGLEVFVEDQDEVEGVPSDSLYAAALLDWDPTLGESAFDYVAYRGYLDPRDPLDLYYSSYESPIKRPPPFVRSITLRDATQRFDLCNGAGRPIAPGYHTLSLIVSDRAWFQQESETIDTSDTGESDPLETGPITLDGVPDIAAGATYDIQTYVFVCLEGSDPLCNCEAVTDGG